MTPTLTEPEIRQQLDALQPEIPWAHFFDFGHGISSVDESNDTFLRKSKSLSRIAELMGYLSKHHVKGGTLEGKRVLDLACGEGAHSIYFARLGATVLGLDGRQLYVDRATFAARTQGQSQNTSFITGDVRHLDAEELGTFDVVIASGILHHLNTEAFYDFISGLRNVCDDTAFIYTHISTALSIQNHRLKGPVYANDAYEGYLFREHAENASEEQKRSKVRASLDNSTSFWATETALVQAARDAGWDAFYRMHHPAVFSNLETGSYRPVFVLRK